MLNFYLKFGHFLLSNCFCFLIRGGMILAPIPRRYPNHLELETRNSYFTQEEMITLSFLSYFSLRNILN